MVMRAIGFVAGAAPAALLWYLSMASVAKARNFEKAAAVDCCRLMQSRDLNVVSCMRAEAGCRFPLRLVGTGQRKSTIITVQNPGGRLGRGANGFCVYFINAITGQNIPVAGLRLDVTLRIGRVDAARALAEIVSDGPDRYCGHVILRIPGQWKLTFKYVGTVRKGKISLMESVN